MKNAPKWLWIALMAMVAAPSLADDHADPAPKPALKTVYQDHFLVGGAFNGRLVSGRDPGAAEIAATHFNTATSENDMKWAATQPRQGQFDWRTADRFIQFAEEHDMVPIGHTLVWHGSAPRWIFRDDSGDQVTREELLRRMEEHITAVVGRYKGRVKGWDVVNEALNDDGSMRETQWMQIISEGKPEQRYDHIVKAFEFAHKADPDAELYYNDYNLENSRAKCDGAVEIVKHLRDKGLRIDGVGIQLHASLDHPDRDSLTYAIETLAENDVKVMITELDIRTRSRGYRGADVRRINRQNTDDESAENEETQRRLADKYAELFNIFLEHREDISRVTFWGVYDATSWIGGSPLPFDSDYRPKRAFDAIVQAARDATSTEADEAHQADLNE